MKRIETVKQKRDFNNIIHQGKKIVDKFFIIYYIDNEESNITKFGIAISKKVGNAVIRNKLKRRYRNIIDNNKNMFQKQYNYIIMVKKESLFASFSNIENHLQNVLIKEKNEKV